MTQKMTNFSEIEAFAERQNDKSKKIHTLKVSAKYIDIKRDSHKTAFAVDRVNM